METCRASGLSAGHSRYKETRQKGKKLNNSLKFKEFFVSLVIGASKCGCYAGALPLALAQKCHTEPGELFFFINKSCDFVVVFKILWCENKVFHASFVVVFF